MAEHSTLTGSDLHEPKGASTASVNTAYIANGAGSGAWSKVGVNSIDSSSVKGLNQRYIFANIADVSTASSIIVPITEACSGVSVMFMLSNAITIANSTVTVLKNGVTNIGTQTIAFAASAKGTYFILNLSANALVSGDFLEIATDGASTTACVMPLILKIAIT